MTVAILVNPYDPETVATSIAHALSMSLEERRARHAALFHLISENDLRTWGELFLAALTGDPDLPLWREPARIVDMAFLLVVARPGFALLSAEQLATALHLPAAKTPRVQVVSMPLIEIASRDLRRRVAEGKSIRYQVPRGVECYLENHGLYRP